MAFIILSYIPSVLLSGEFLSYMGVLNFVEGFLCLYWGDHMVFIFQFVNIVYHIDWFAYSEESLHPWDKSHLVIV